MSLNWLRSPKKLFVLFFVAGGVLFCNGLNHPQMIDDHVFFDEMGRDPRNLWLNFVPDKNKLLNLEGPKTEVYYRPLALTVPKLTYWILGGNNFGMHLVNLLLFVTAAWMLALFIGRMSSDLPFGVLTALFMLVHPINGIIVNFKTAGIFALEIICMVLALEWTFKDKVSVRDRWGAVLMFFAAIFCHESAFGLPLFAVSLSLIVRGENFQQAWQRSWSLWIAAIAYFFLRMHWASLGTNLFQKYAGYHMSFWEYWASWYSLQAWYVAKFFDPEGIVIWVIKPVIRTGAMDWVVFGSALWFAVIWTIRKFFRQQSWVWLGLTWFIIGMLMLAAGSLFNGKELMVEPHWMVFSSIGFFLILASIITWAMRGFLKIPMMMATAVLFLSWAAWGWSYNALWNDEKDYCFYWLEQNPSFNPVHMYIARAYFGEYKLDLAAKHYKLALANEYPDYLMYANLGTIALLQDKLGLAQAYLIKALMIEPRCAKAIDALGLVFVREGNWPKAEICFKHAAAINPYDSTASRNLQLLYKYRYSSAQIPVFLR